MSIFKQLVSKKKRRFQEDGFDLDLTYIKPNIVAMGFPSEKLEGVYRNSSDDVYRFLETRHKDHYKVYNLCQEKSYDPAKFQNRVATFPFEDHNAPPYELIKPFCDDVDEYLKADDRNVAIIHCKAGKGRTGVMICAYLMHNKSFTKTMEALVYYGNARTWNAKGVTIPSQRRYVLYYSHALRNELAYTPTMVLLRGLEMNLVPNFQNGTSNVSFMMWQQKVKLYESKVGQGNRKSDKSAKFYVVPPIPICGDIKMEFFHKDVFKKERMFQFWFNTFFITTIASANASMEGEETLRTFEEDADIRSFRLPREALDKAHKDTKCRNFSRGFEIKVLFSEVGDKVPDRSTSKDVSPVVATQQMDSHGSFPRAKKQGKKHRKCDSLGSVGSYQDRLDAYSEDDDDISDTDNEDEWEKEQRHEYANNVPSSPSIRRHAHKEPTTTLV